MECEASDETATQTVPARRFFDRYAAALSRFDLDALIDAYRVPLPVVRPDRTRVVEDAPTLRAEIGKILDFYRWSGMTGVDIDGFRVDGFAEGMDVVSLTWLPRTAEGAEIARIDVTFALRRTRDGGRIAAMLAHNEERHRVPILREALGGRTDTDCSHPFRIIGPPDH
jgi:hypothetical protein